MSPPVLIIGCGGHAKVVIELFQAENRYEIEGLIGQIQAAHSVHGIPIVGADEDLPRFFASGLQHVFVAVGDNHLRLRLARHCQSIGFEPVNAISPRAIISPSAKLGRGIAIMAGAVINAAASIGDHTIINTRATVDHDCQVGAACHVAPGCSLAGNVTVGDRTFLGVGTCVIPGRVIGSDSVVGAGSCVVRDIESGVIAFGVPAKTTRALSFNGASGSLTHDSGRN